MFNVALLRLMFFCGGFWRKFGVQSHRVCCHWMSGPSIVAVMGVVKVWCGRAFPPVFNSSDYQLLLQRSSPLFSCVVATVGRKLFIDSAFMSQSRFSSLPH